YCNAITRTVQGGVPIISAMRIQPFNFSSQKAQGIDLEASYRTPLDSIIEGADGNLTFRALATRFIENFAHSGVPTDAPNDSVGGHIQSGPPKWRYNFSLNYDTESYNVNF